MTDVSECSENYSEEIIFRKGEDQDSIWDDTALIEAYDRAVSLTYDAVNLQEKGETSASDTQSATKDKRKKKVTNKSNNYSWRVGDRCLAPFSYDGELYEAKITSLDTDDDSCIVSYVGYDEEESQPMSGLQKYVTNRCRRRRVRRHSTHQLQPRIKILRIETEDTSRADSDDEEMRGDTAGSSSSIKKKKQVHKLSSPSHSVPLIPPPPPPSWLDLKSMPSDKDALSSMLMSWYMSGYHTGYYQAMQDMKTGAQ